MAKRKGSSELSERAQYLLKLLVERYIHDGQPVGSRTLARYAQIELSPATIRNVMSDLEALGLVSSPHTSAGRIPTNQGYRLFVDSLLTVQNISAQEVERFSRDLQPKDSVTSLLKKASAILSEVTQFAGVVTIPRSGRKALRHVEFLPMSDNRVLAILVLDNDEVQNKIIKTEHPHTAAELEQAANYLNNAFVGRDIASVRQQLLHEMSVARFEMSTQMNTLIEITEKTLAAQDDDEDYVISGETKLMAVSELCSIDTLRRLFDAFNEKREILLLLDQALNAHGVSIFIGEESGYEVLGGCSVVTSTYQVDGTTLGVLGIIGPTRMPYERVIPIVDLTARILGSALKSLH